MCNLSELSHHSGWVHLTWFRVFTEVMDDLVKIDETDQLVWKHIYDSGLLGIEIVQSIVKVL